MDPLLRRILDAPAGEERDRVLSSIVELDLLPLARAIVSGKLRTYSGRSDHSDREDVVSEAMMTLLERLRALESGAAAPIDNLLNYAATVVHSACAHYVRRRYPERARLKARLRYVLSTAPALALWPNADGELDCGLTQWRGRPVAAESTSPLRQAIASQARSWSDMRPGELARSLATAFATIGVPVSFEVLVGTVAEAACLREPQATADSTRLSSESISQELAIDQRRLLARVWNEVCQLPLGQRAALLLNLRGAGGAGVLWLLPLAGVATIRQVARVLEVPDVEFAHLWREMPLDDEAIAHRLGCTRQQVINLRMAGRKRLSNRLRSHPSIVSLFTGRAANLRPGSTSLKGSV